jgi:hypothetical protein
MNPRRDLAVLVGAVGVSAAGDIAAVSALAVQLQRETGSGLVVAALFAANWLALAVLAPWAGALVDRMDARRLLVLASVGQALVAAALASTPGTPGVLALSALLGAGAAFAVPAEFALVGVVATQAGGAARANARVETARYAGYLVGPLAGTALVGIAGVGAALAADAASFAVVAVGGWALRARRPAPGAAAGARPRARDGIALLARDRVLRVTVAVLVGSLIAMSTSISADVFFAQQTLGAGAVGLGLLLSAWMLGMVAGALVLAPRVPVRLIAAAAVAAAGLQGLGKAGAAALGLLPAALLLYALGGAAHGVKNTSARALIHERVAPEAHGRAFAAYAALRNCAELAALGLGGLLVELVGARTTLVLAGAGTAVAAVLGLGALRERRLGSSSSLLARRSNAHAVPPMK